jgi:hypothetical protein
MSATSNQIKVASPPAALPPLEYFDGEPQFRFFVAGAGASGKTVFLASMYKNLTVTGQKSKYYAELTSQRDIQTLREKIEQILDSSRDWPRGNVDATDYVFRCFHNAINVQERFSLFRFHYTDFPGGNMTFPNEGQALNVRAAVEAAHSVVFLLDGQKILDASKKRMTEGFSINDDLDIIAELANACIFRPMQFAITKWDLLTEHFSLAEIRQFLFQNPKFAAIAGERRSRSLPTYLIPVSALGNKFASYDPKTKRMVKRPDGVLDPYNLDVLLALAITDSLLNVFKASLSRADLIWFRAARMIIGVANAAKWVSKGGAIFLDDAWSLRMLVILDQLGDMAVKGLGKYQDQVDKRLANVRSKNTALDSIVEIQKLLVDEFLAREPHADLLKKFEGEQ